jgi:hypothetical protein
MTTKVECYSGSTYPESPRGFTWEGQRYQVCDIIQRRREPAGVGFLVRCCEDNTLFDLFYLTEEDQWQIQPKGSAKLDYKNQNKPNVQGE